MARVARTGKHREFASDLLREHHSVPVIREEGVLQLMEHLKISRPRDTDRRAMVAVAPSHIVLAVKESHPRIISINPLCDLGVGS